MDQAPSNGRTRRGLLWLTAVPPVIYLVVGVTSNDLRLGPVLLVVASLIGVVVANRMWADRVGTTKWSWPLVAIGALFVLLGVSGITNADTVVLCPGLGILFVAAPFSREETA